MPSSRHAGRISSSTSRAHSEYSVCSAVIGWIFAARARDFGPASESPRKRTLPAFTGPAVVGLAAVRVVDVAELGADDGTVAPAFQRAAEHALVPPLHVAVGGVEERDAEIHRAVHRRDLHLVVALAEVRGGAARPQAYDRDRRAVLPELAVFHG